MSSRFDALAKGKKKQTKKSLPEKVWRGLLKVPGVSSKISAGTALLDTSAFGAPSFFSKTFRKARDISEEVNPIADNLGVLIGILSPGGVGKTVGKGLVRAAGKSPAIAKAGEKLIKGGEALKKYTPTDIVFKKAKKVTGAVSKQVGDDLSKIGGGLSKLGLRPETIGAKIGQLTGKSPVTGAHLTRQGADFIKKYSTKYIGGGLRAGAPLASEGALWGAFSTPEDDLSDEKASASSVLSNAVRGAKTGFAVGPAFKALGAIPGGLRSAGRGLGVYRTAEDFFSDSIFGVKNAAPQSVERFSQFFKPVVKTLAKDLGPDDITELNQINKTNAKSIQGIWDKSKTKDKFRILIRWLEKKFPDVTDADGLYEKSQKETLRLGEELQNFRSLFKTELRNNLDFIDPSDVIDIMGTAYGRSSEKIKALIALKIKDYDDKILKTGNEYFTKDAEGEYKATQLLKASLGIKTQRDWELVLNKPASKELDTLVDSFSDFISARKNKGITVADIDEFLLNSKKNLDIYELVGQVKKAQSLPSKRFFGILGDIIKETYEDYGAQQQFNLRGKTFKDISDEYALMRRFSEVLGKSPKGHFLSYFQVANITPNFMGVAPTGARGPTGLLSKAGAGAVVVSSKVKLGYPQLSKAMQKFESRSPIGQKPYNPLHLLKNIYTDKQTIIPRLTVMDIASIYPSSQRKNDTLRGESMNIKKKLPDKMKPGFDVEMYKMKQRMEEVKKQNLPKEAKGKMEDFISVPKWKQRRYEDYMTAALSPEYLLQKIENGTITQTNVAQFKHINPWLYNRLAFDLYNAYNKAGLKLKYSQKLALGLFLGQDLTGLKGGIFNVLEESAEPIGITKEDGGSEGDYIKGYVRKGTYEDKKSTSQRIESM